MNGRLGFDLRFAAICPYDSSIMQRMQTHLRTTFLAGAFAIIPIAVTVAVVIYAESMTRGPLRGTPLDFPGSGILIAVVLVYASGLIVSSVAGKYFLRLFDRTLDRVPLLRDLYKAWKQISFTPGGGEGIYAKVVLIPDGRGVQHVMAFSSGETIAPDTDTVAVFVPNAPNPVTGRVAFVHARDLIVTSLSPEEAFKLLLSSGNYVPAEVATKLGTLQLPTDIASSPA